MKLKVDEIYNGGITSQENTGLGVSIIDDVVVFVENGLPGDKGDILITDIKRRFARGKMIKLDEISDQRIVPACPYYDHCGGCQIQHQKYVSQLKFKEYKIKMAMEHIGKLMSINIKPIISGSEYEYRNKVSLKVEDNKIGYYQELSNTLVDIDKCPIADVEINKVIKIIKNFIMTNHNHNIDSVVIRHSQYLNEIMIIIESVNFELKRIFIEYITKRLDNIKSIILNDKIIYGTNYITEKIGSLLFNISPLSFFQVNTEQLKKLYEIVLKYTNNINNNLALDLYCGTGTITSLLASKFKKVVGIEVVEDAIEDAKVNIEMNKIDNVFFILGKVEDNIDKFLNRRVDLIILDPPRKGSDQKTLDSIIKINPKKIIYVSCNPTTLARDLKYLVANNYTIKEITPVDMFPQTEHVECVTILHHKD